MSLEEKSAMRSIDYMLKLYLQEAKSNFTIDKIHYGPITFVKSSNPYQPGSWKYLHGTVTIKDKYSPMRMTIDTADLYATNKWRNTMYLPARYTYMLAHPDCESTRADDHTTKELSGILKIIKGIK